MSTITHIAFIMDGNGRWAKERGLQRTDGHSEGVNALSRVIKSCVDKGVKYMTFFAFSTENWTRPKKEVSFIFLLVNMTVKKKIKELTEKKIKLKFIGEIDALPESTKKIIKFADEKQKELIDPVATVIIALNYGGKSDILHSVNKILSLGKTSCTVEDISNNLSTAGIPDPDIMVRSSGEMRISNFLLWQCAYSEFIFINDYWPDFNNSTVNKIFDEYSKRNRRFGNIG